MEDSFYISRHGVARPWRWRCAFLANLQPDPGRRLLLMSDQLPANFTCAELERECRRIFGCDTIVTEDNPEASTANRTYNVKFMGKV